MFLLLVNKNLLGVGRDRTDFPSFISPQDSTRSTPTRASGALPLMLLHLVHGQGFPSLFYNVCGHCPCFSRKRLLATATSNQGYKHGALIHLRFPYALCEICLVRAGLDTG